MNSSNQQAITTGSSVDFVTFLQDHPDYLQACSDGLTKLTAQCHEHLGKGSLTLKLKFQAGLQGKTVIVAIEPETPKIASPKATWAAKPYFATEHGQLLREHPGQMGLFDDREEPTIQEPSQD